MSLKANLLANYFGQGWRALMSIVFVPLYVRYLGVEVDDALEIAEKTDV